MGSIETRQIERDSLLLTAAVRVDGSWSSHPIKVRNLSVGGMMAEGELQVELGSPVAVELRNVGKVRGWVAWIEGNRFGVAFVTEIDPKLVRAPFSTGVYDLASPRFTRPPVGRDETGPLRSI